MKKLSALMLSAALCFTSVPVLANEVVADEEESTAVYSAYTDHSGWLYNSTINDGNILSVPCKGKITFTYFDWGVGDSKPIDVVNSDGQVVGSLTNDENKIGENNRWVQSVSVEKGTYYLKNANNYSVTADFTPDGDYTGWQFNGYEWGLGDEQLDTSTKNQIWYYYKNGKLVSDWQYINGSWYWFYPEGTISNAGILVGVTSNYSNEMATSTWVWDGQYDYYVLDNGKMAKSCWIYTRGDDGYDHWFYMKANGTKLTSSWLNSKGKWYYLNEYGYMASNEWIEQDGNWYYVRSNGVMAANETICGNKFDSHGVWLGKE